MYLTKLEKERRLARLIGVIGLHVELPLQLLLPAFLPMQASGITQATQYSTVPTYVTLVCSDITCGGKTVKPES